MWQTRLLFMGVTQSDGVRACLDFTLRLEIHSFLLAHRYFP